MPACPIIPASAGQLSAWRDDGFSMDAARVDAVLAGGDVLRQCVARQRAPVILDLHFGFGLAFLLSWRRFIEAVGEGTGAHLHYIAILPHPCSAAQLAAAHAGWPQLAEQAQALRAAWPLPLPGTHRLFLAGGRITLTLVFGAVEQALSQLQAGVDVFYLHGRPGLTDPALRAWSPALAKRIARLAWTGAQAVSMAPDAALAAALRQVGFVPAQAVDAADAAYWPHWYYAPRWRRPPSHVAASDTPVTRTPAHAQDGRHALIIGAGLAGCAAAERLAARGWRIDLIDAGQEPAQRASGNHGGLCMPALARDDSALARLTRAAYLFAQRHWQQLGGVGLSHTADTGIIGEACGILQFARDARQAVSFEAGAAEWQYPAGYARWMSAQETAALLGRPSMGGGYFFPDAPWLNPPSVCRRMLHVARAQGHGLGMYFSRDVAALRRHDDGLWQALDPTGQVIAAAPVVIIAAGAQARHLLSCAALPLNAVRGQVTHLAADGFPEVPVALCGDGYLTRPLAGRLCIGASYDRDDETGLRMSSHADNLARLRSMLPAIDDDVALPDAGQAALEGRVGFRCIAPDRLPLVGAMPDQAGEGVYGLLGYASRGLIWAPLMAELLASMLEREPLPLPRELIAMLAPGRFVADGA